MARDYAKMYSGRYRRHRGSWGYYLLTGLICLVLGAGAMYFSYHFSSHFLINSSTRERDRLSVPRSVVSKAPEQEKSVAVEEADHAVVFDFYNTLPATHTGSESALPDKTALAVSSSASTRETVLGGLPASVAPVHYVLQLGVFADRNTAARRRLNFLLAGIDSIIVRETSQGGKVLFRIQQGSYSTEKAARVASDRFRRRGVQGIVRKVVDIDATVPI